MGRSPKKPIEIDVQLRCRTLHLTHQELTKGKPLELEEFQVVTEAYCPNGHNLINDLATFRGFNGITVQLRDERQVGQLSLSPIIGDLSRTFFNFKRVEGAIIEIGCPTCSEVFPPYDRCECGANLVALFTRPKKDFANCIGICPRIGCLHSKIISNYSLRKFSRLGYY
ncbi:MAG TPA: hypothetical protein VIA07_07040 [Desulfuromonadales bacterium]|jgi:hypothetical protein